MNLSLTNPTSLKCFFGVNLNLSFTEHSGGDQDGEWKDVPIPDSNFDSFDFPTAATEGHYQRWKNEDGSGVGLNCIGDEVGGNNICNTFVGSKFAGDVCLDYAKLKKAKRVGYYLNILKGNLNEFARAYNEIRAIMPKARIDFIVGSEEKNKTWESFYVGTTPKEKGASYKALANYIIGLLKPIYPDIYWIVDSAPYWEKHSPEEKEWNQGEIGILGDAAKMYFWKHDLALTATNPTQVLENINTGIANLHNWIIDFKNAFPNKKINVEQYGWKASEKDFVTSFLHPLYVCKIIQKVNEINRKNANIIDCLTYMSLKAMQNYPAVKRLFDLLCPMWKGKVYEGGYFSTINKGIQKILVPNETSTPITINSVNNIPVSGSATILAFDKLNGTQYTETNPTFTSEIILPKYSISLLTLN